MLLFSFVFLYYFCCCLPFLAEKYLITHFWLITTLSTLNDNVTVHRRLMVQHITLETLVGPTKTFNPLSTNLSLNLTITNAIMSFLFFFEKCLGKKVAKKNTNLTWMKIYLFSFHRSTFSLSPKKFGLGLEFEVRVNRPQKVKAQPQTLAHYHSWLYLICRRLKTQPKATFRLPRAITIIKRSKFII